MTILKILEFPDPRLRIKARPLETVDEALRQLIDDMFETMYDAPGIGLSAPQVAAGQRVIVCDVAREGAAPRPYRMINPESTWRSDENVVAEEGCLSIPDYYAEVSRSREIRVGYFDPDGAAQKLDATGLLSACIQHEIDHLNGVLFIDYLPPLTRNIILRKMKKLKRQQA